uniref:Uncharacterized protein n=1 Tax=Lepeophtheirus salmonis TaxID=72036 RepID=A0A0K2UES8_LEPSM
MEDVDTVITRSTAKSMKQDAKTFNVSGLTVRMYVKDLEEDSFVRRHWHLISIANNAYCEFK